MTVPRVVRVPVVSEPGLSLDPGFVHNGGNGGYQALNLAVLLGGARIYLLGFDMRIVGGRAHWHGDHVDGMRNPGDGALARWVKNFGTTPKDLKRAGVEVINCTPGSALECFPFGELGR